MNQGQLLRTVTVDPLQHVWRTVVAYLPQLLGALALLLVGWLVAIVLRKVTGKMLRALGLDVLAERTGGTAILRRGGIQARPSELLGRGVYWLILFSALVATFNALGLEVASLLLRAIVLYIPNLLVALLLLGLGFFASRYVDTLVTATAAGFNLPFPDAWGRTAQVFILLLAGAMVLSELGIATALVSIGFIVLLSVAGSATVVAFGLGTRDIVTQLAAGQCLRHILHPNDSIQYSDYEGIIQEVGLTHVSLKTEQGIVTIPNTVLLHSTIVKQRSTPTTSTLPTTSESEES